MKKHTFLVFHREYPEFLEQLGKLGVLHVIEKSEGERDEKLDEKEARLDRINDVLSLLDKMEKEYPDAVRVHPASEDTLEIVKEVEQLEEEIDILGHQVEETRKLKEKFMPWGDFDPEVMRSLDRSGYTPWLLKCSTRQFDPAWEVRDDLFIIERQGGSVYMLLLTEPGTEPGLTAEYHRPPDRSLKEISAELEAKEEERQKMRERLAGLAGTVPGMLEPEIRRLESEIAVLHVHHETQRASEDALMILEGWVPAESERSLEELTSREGIVNIITPPAEGEQPPVELKNNRFSRLFEPISKLFDLPSYREMDLTPYFAPFFMLFFGFCLGDAGYGVFFILFAAILKLRVKKEFKPILSLTQYLGVATIIFGLLSGTFFGVNLIDSGYTLTETSIQNLENKELPATVLSGLESMEGTYYKNRADFLAAVNENIGASAMELHEATIMKNAEAGIPFIGKFRHLMQDSLSMFYLALLIGGVQIVFGILIRIFNITRQRGFKYALSTLGWLILIVGAILHYTGALAGMTGSAAPYIFYGLLGVSGLFIFVLNKPGAGVIARVGGGVWDAYGMVTGIFGDLLSYIRLFALGISSAILGFVFNDISLQLLNIPYVGWLFFLILLLVGHSINLFLATLGGFIHPMRLTFVEFYKNAGFQGGGKQYEPFRIHN
jgi:V/A-type H+-transporting ATPase subunit I